MPRLRSLVIGFVLAGCATGTSPVPRTSAPPDGGESDAGAPAPTRDAGARADAGPPDAGAPDAGPPDAGCPPEACNGLDDDCDARIDEGAGCPCDRREHGGHAYLVCPDARSWLGARSRCEASGYTLAVVETAAEDAFLYGEIASRGLDDTWIGLNDAVTEGTWVWLDGVPLGYEHWDEGEPNDGAGGEDCGVIMTREGRESEWDDRPCDGERPYLCEAGAP